MDPTARKRQGQYPHRIPATAASIAIGIAVVLNGMAVCSDATALLNANVSLRNG